MCRFENCAFKRFCMIRDMLSMEDKCEKFMPLKELSIKENNKMEELETCKGCNHYEVCSLKHQFASCLQAVKGCIANTPDGGSKYLEDIDFINISLNCKHYKENA